MADVAVMKRVHSWEPICSVEPWVRHPNPEKTWRQTRGAEVNCCAPEHPANPKLHRGRSFQTLAEDWSQPSQQPGPDGKWRVPGPGRLALFNDDEDPGVAAQPIDLVDLANEPDDEPRPLTDGPRGRLLIECIDPEDVPTVVVVPRRQRTRAPQKPSRGRRAGGVHSVKHDTHADRRPTSMSKSSRRGRPRVSEESQYIHVRLPSELHNELKCRATVERRNLRSVIVDLLRVALDSKRVVTDSHEEVGLPTASMKS